MLYGTTVVVNNLTNNSKYNQPISNTFNAANILAMSYGSNMFDFEA